MVVKIIMLEVEAGKATPAYPIGPALGAAGVNIMLFCKQFNDMTSEMQGIMRVKLLVYGRDSIKIELLGPTTTYLIKSVTGIEKGSDKPNKNKVGTLTAEQLDFIVNTKYKYLKEIISKEGLRKSIIGSAECMGLNVES